MTRRITDAEKKELLSINCDDINYTLLTNLFVKNLVNGKVQQSRFEPQDVFTLKKGEYLNNDTIETTVGSLIFNKFIIEPRFSKVMNYNNEVINNKGLSKLESKLSELLKDDKITTEDFADYLNRIQWLGNKLHEVIASSFTMRGMKPVPKVIKERDKLIKENKKALEKGDIITMSNIENELIKTVEKEIGDDPSMDLYYSGARGSISNNYKQLSIVKGPIMNLASGKYEFITKNFYEGLEKDEIPATGSNVVNGAFPKTCEVKYTGYKTKQMNSALQSIVLRKDVEDCGSKGYVEILLTKEVAAKCSDRYIIDGNKKVLLNNENMSKYIGKKVKLRSIMYCGCDYGVCLTCAGLSLKKIGIDVVGLTGNALTGSLVNIKMKSFHDTSVKTNEINLDDITF